MKKALRFLLVLTLSATAAGILPVSSLVVAPEAQAVDCYRCRCALGTGTTGNQCADGPTCAAATGALGFALENSTGCTSFCQSDLTITMACAPNGGGGYWVCGYLTYQCEICIDTCA